MFSKLLGLLNRAREVFELQDIKALLLKLSILLLGIFAPLHQILISLLFLVLLDFITGILAAIKKKQKITSSRLSRTISKLLVYCTTVGAVHITNSMLLFGENFLPLESFVVGFIAVTELKSIFENLNRISRQPFLSDLIGKLSNEGRKKKKDRKR